MVNKTKEWEGWVLKILVSILILVFGTLYTQQNRIIAGQEKRFRAYQEKTDKVLETKVDNKTLQMMIRRLDDSKADRLRIKRQQEKDRAKWEAERKKQRKVNQKLIETLHSLELHIKEFEE